MGRRRARRFNRYYLEIASKRLIRSIQLFIYKYTR